MLSNLYFFAHALIITAFWLCLAFFAAALGIMFLAKKEAPKKDSKAGERGEVGKRVEMGRAQAGAFGSFDFLKLFENFAVVLGVVLLNTGLVFMSALVKGDPALKYVSSHISSFMPLAYKFSAFWAGAEGSLLFWTIAFSLVAVIFRYLPIYKGFSRPAMVAFWGFYFLIIAAFLFLLGRESNPFALQNVVMEGSGLIGPVGQMGQISPLGQVGQMGLLGQQIGQAGISQAGQLSGASSGNQVLQNPIMLVHPPFLLVAYAISGVAAALALASLFTKSDILGSVNALRGFTLAAFAFMVAGIVLGGFWAFYEPSWGSYWRWDPVENTSLLPALVSLAALHGLAAQKKRPIQNQNPVVSSLLVVLGFVLILFATYVVRSGVLNSNHAFARNRTADYFMFLAILLVALAVLGIFLQKMQKRALNLSGKDILMTLSILLLLEIALVIGAGTVWPVLSLFFRGQASSVGADFYNKAVPPLFILLALLTCFHLVIKGQKAVLGRILSLLALFLLLALALVLAGLVSVVLAFAASAGLLLFLLALLNGGLSSWAGLSGGLRANAGQGIWANAGASAGANAGANVGHVAFALLLVGVGFSSGLKKEFVLRLEPGKTISVSGYNVTLARVNMARTADYIFAQAEVDVTGKGAGTLRPESRIYKNGNTASVAGSAAWGGSIFSPVATLVSLEAPDKGNDLRFATIKLTENPLLNFVWLGGTLLCLAPLMGLVGTLWRKKEGLLP